MTRSDLAIAGARLGNAPEEEFERAQQVLAKAICVTSGMRLWQFNFGVRVVVVDVLVVLFIAVSLVRFVAASRPMQLARELQHTLQFQLAWLAIATVSGLRLIFYPVAESSLSQFLKVDVALASNVCFFALFLLFLQRLPSAKRENLLRWFVGGIIGSCVYELAQVALFSLHKIDLDVAIFGRISVGGADRVDFLRNTKEWGPWVRGTGFMGGADAQGVYVAMVLPLLIRYVIDGAGWRVVPGMFVAVVAIAMTMSRSGMISLTVSLLFLAVFEWRRISRPAGFLVAALIPVAMLTALSWNLVRAILMLRLSVDQSRVRLFRLSWEIFSHHPFGVGLGNFDVILPRLHGEILEHNPHNSWMGTLVELGPPGLLVQLGLTWYFFSCARRMGGALANSFAATVLGVAVGALFNNNLNLFAVQFNSILVFGLIVLSHREHALTRA